MPDAGGTNVDMREVQRNFAKLARNAPEVAQRAGELAAEAFISEAQENAPKKTGFLANSDFNEKLGRSGRRFGFGAVYAAAVEVTHPTKSGYLRSAIIDNAKKFLPAAFKRALEEKGGLRS